MQTRFYTCTISTACAQYASASTIMLCGTNYDRASTNADTSVLSIAFRQSKIHTLRCNARRIHAMGRNEMVGGRWIAKIKSQVFTEG